MSDSSSFEDIPASVNDSWVVLSTDTSSDYGVDDYELVCCSRSGNSHDRTASHSPPLQEPGEPPNLGKSSATMDFNHGDVALQVTRPKSEKSPHTSEVAHFYETSQECTVISTPKSVKSQSRRSITNSVIDSLGLTFPLNVDVKVKPGSSLSVQNISNSSATSRYSSPPSGSTDVKKGGCTFSPILSDLKMASSRDNVVNEFRSNPSVGNRQVPQVVPDVSSRLQSLVSPRVANNAVKSTVTRSDEVVDNRESSTALSSDSVCSMDRQPVSKGSPVISTESNSVASKSSSDANIHPSSRSYAWEEYKFRLAVHPKPVPKSVVESSSYNLR